MMPPLPAPSQDHASDSDEELLPPLAAPSKDHASDADENMLPLLPVYSQDRAAAADEEMPPPSPAPSHAHVSAADDAFPTYSQLQSQNRIWTTDAENLMEPQFSKGLEQTKVYCHRSTPIQYFNNIFPEELFEIIVSIIINMQH